MSLSQSRLLAFDLGETLKITDSPRTIPGGVDVGGTTGSIGMIYRSVADFLNVLLPLSFVIAGVILLFLLIGGGFAIVASGGNAKSVEQGKGQITGAVIGFLVIFAAYWIIQVVEVVTGVPILSGSGL